MVALIGILLLCGAVLFITQLIDSFFVYEAVPRAALWFGGLGVCALLLIGFYVF